LLPPGVGVAAANAYRDLRRAQHRARLDEKPTQFPLDAFADQARAIKSLWQVSLT
jgi:[glutamine synthetase] adenylyltransferase / [glutamine synthetase]-adenylyl-L-tyrosine phosphorylase